LRRRPGEVERDIEVVERDREIELVVGVGRDRQGELLEVLGLEEAGDAGALVGRDRRQDLGSTVHVAPEDGRLVVDDGDRERVRVDVHVLVGKVEPALGRDVAEKVHRLVKVVDDVRLVANQVAKLVARRRVDEAVADPLARLDAAGSLGKERTSAVSFVEQEARKRTHTSEISATRSNASSTPSSVISTPDSSAASYAARSKRSR
jgi:hypothetical protein